MRWLLVLALLGCQAPSATPPIPPPPVVTEPPGCDEAGIESVRIGPAAPKFRSVARANPCARSR